jgi:hypothetical protein
VSRIEKRVQRILRKASRAEDIAAKDQLRLLADMRRSLLSILGEASGFRFFHLSQVLSSIDAAISNGRAGSQQAAEAATRQAYALGVEVLRQEQGFVGVGSELLQAAIEVTRDQARGVWSELGTKLKATVRRTTLGITDPAEAVRSVVKLIRNRKTFATAEQRAETIVRTEVNRTFSLGAWKEMERSGEVLGSQLRKAWLDAGDDRVRDAHRKAGEDYSADKAIPMEEPFIVDGEELMFPLDPRGSAENTINCRCKLLPVVGDEA